MAVSQPALKIGAAVFLIATALYGAALIYYNRHGFPTATIGATYRFSVIEQAMRVERVVPGGPAARAGIGDGDLIVAVDGRAINGSYPLWNAVERGEPGETVSLGVRRPDETEPRRIQVALDRVDLPSTIN
jgi:S1-C subfamily serine protease